MSNDGSPIGRRLKETGELLLGGAQKQVQGYKSRFAKLEGAYDDFLSKLIVQHSEKKIDGRLIDEFFGKRRLRFAGIDGTVHKQDVFDLVIFFAGAYASQGEISVSEQKEISISYEERSLDKGIGVSSVLPIYISEVPQVDQTLLIRDSTGQVDTTVTFSDSKILDNSAFADYLMALAEFYLGYRLVSKEEPVDILLLDRICSSEISSFYAETSDFRIDLDSECGLIGTKVAGRKFTKTDWVYARQVFGNDILSTPPARGEYLLPRVIVELAKDGSTGLTQDEIIDRLELDNDHRIKRLGKELKKGIKGERSAGGVISRKGNHYVLKPRYRDLKQRVAQLVDDVCSRIFSPDTAIDFDQRFKIGNRWLTTNDLSFLSLACLYLTMERCWENRTLLVGVAKDTSARDMKRQLIPVLNYLGLFEGNFESSSTDAPDTDRMILQWVSLQERDTLKVPWTTIEYDTAFKTIVPHFDSEQGMISGARRNQVSLNKTFVKSYFQLSQADSDEKLRSNVLLYERLAYPEFDQGDKSITVLKHDYGGKTKDPEPVEVVLYKDSESALQDLVIQIFVNMTSMSIPDLFGHLKPLYVADKIAKTFYSQFVNMVQSTGSWLLCHKGLREFLFYLSTFRERRTNVEQSRRHT